jgi:hypothetical protein
VIAAKGNNLPSAAVHTRFEGPYSTPGGSESIRVVDLLGCNGRTRFEGVHLADYESIILVADVPLLFFMAAPARATAGYLDGAHCKDTFAP